MSINPDPNQGSGQDNKEGSKHGSRVLRNVVKTRQKQEIGSVIRGKSFYSDYWFFMSSLQQRPLSHLAFWISYLMKEGQSSKVSETAEVLMVTQRMEQCGRHGVLTGRCPSQVTFSS